MQNLSDNIMEVLNSRSKNFIPVVEIYPRDTIELADISAPANAIGRFSYECFDWVNSTGTYKYEAKVLDFPEIVTYLSGEINTAEVLMSNVKRGDGSSSRFVLNNKIKGCWMVIRLLFPKYPDESVVLFWGKCGRPGEITNEELTLTATQDLGNYKQEIPFRSYMPNCPLEFARPGSPCMGHETLAEKSPAYREAAAVYGSSGCNKLFSTCTLFQNTEFFQGQRVVAVSGQFSYVTVEEVVKRVLFWTKRKKIRTVKTDNWSSVNQSEGSEDIPLAFGRCQIQGHPITWADTGTQVKSLQGFCEGKISAFDFVRSRVFGINIVQKIEHLGEYGGIGTQQLDTIFNGVSGYNSGLAYLELITDGSQPTQTDDAPLVTAVIRGIEIPVPDILNNFTIKEATNNPVYVTRFVLTDLRFGRIPSYRIDDDVAIETAAECDTIIEDRTNCESIVLPSNEFDNYDITYRRYRSSGVYTAYRDMYEQGTLGVQAELLDSNLDPAFEQPYIRWYNPFEPYVLPPDNTVLRQKYTFNGALQEKISILDFVYERVLPTFKGFINYGFNGKIQIKTRKKADNGYLRMDADYGSIRIPVSNIKPWRDNPGGFLVISVAQENAEIRTVTGIEYSTACNDLPIAATVTTGVTATTENITGGTDLKPGTGYVDLGGNVQLYSKVELTFNTGDDAFKVSYTADGTEDLECFARMLTAYLNANVQFQSYLYAYILPKDPTRINIRCEAGYLKLNKPTEFKHFQGDEVMRVLAVFENCSELTANESAQFDNIVDNSFKWNNEEDDEINAVVATYTSAVDDFALSQLIPRAAWDTIDLEGELSKHELDLTFVDNYWQAAFLAKCEAIERIDGNLHFSFSTNAPAIRLELGDVVAVRHDSGDGALNYVPVYITKLDFDLNEFEVNISAKLYLSAAHDLHVQPIEPLLTTTLNATENPHVPPPTTGTSGGAGGGTDPTINRPDHGYYEQFAGLGTYSPDGLDRV